MPYIKQPIRDKLHPHIVEIVKITLAGSKMYWMGTFNYVMTKIAITLWADCRTYDTANSIKGAFQCASEEFTRRHLAPYENDKKEENGDVFPIPRGELDEGSK